MKYVTDTISKKLYTDSALHQKFIELYVPKSVAKNDKNRPAICNQTTSAIIWRLFSRCTISSKQMIIWFKDLGGIEVEFLIRGFFEEDTFSKEMFSLLIEILKKNSNVVHWEDVYNGIMYNLNCFQYLVSSGEAIKFLEFLFESSGLDLEGRIACTYGFAVGSNALNFESSAFDELLEQSIDRYLLIESTKSILTLNVVIKMVNYLKTKNKLTFALVVKIIEKIQSSARPNLELLLELLRFISAKQGTTAIDGNSKDAGKNLGRRNLFLKRVNEI